MQIQTAPFETLRHETTRLQTASTEVNAVVSEQPYFNEPDAGAQRPRNGGVVAGLVARRDALPEHADYYRDDGCSVAPSCLTCPLERCRYDVPLQTGRKNARRDDVLRMRREGVTADAIATLLGVSRRTVFRLSKP